MVNNEAYAHDYIKFLVIKYEISKEDVKKIVDLCYRNITDMSEEKCNQMLEKNRKNEYKLSDEIFQKKKEKGKERDEGKNIGAKCIPICLLKEDSSAVCPE